MLLLFFVSKRDLFCSWRVIGRLDYGKVEARNDFVPATRIADSDGQGVVWCFFAIFGKSDSPTRKGLGSSVHGMGEVREDAILCLVAVIGRSQGDLQPGEREV